MSSDPKMVQLLNSFPSMPCKDVQEWSGNFITRESGGLRDIYGSASSGQRRAIEFCLSVWNRDTDWTQWGYEQFHLTAAWGLFDEGHRRALLAWARDPYFP